MFTSSAICGDHIVVMPVMSPSRECIVKSSSLSDWYGTQSRWLDRSVHYMFCLTLYHLIAICLQFVVILFDNIYILVNKSNHGTTDAQMRFQFISCLLCVCILEQDTSFI